MLYEVITNGHNRDTLMMLEESGIGDVLREDRIPFVDLNLETGYPLKNAGGYTRISTLRNNFV